MVLDACNDGQTTAAPHPLAGSRNPDGTFTAGNPARPKGSRHRSTHAALSLLDGEVEGLTRKAVELALDGDATALRLCLERICPPRKDTPVTFTPPPMVTAADAVQAAGAVLAAVSAGDLTHAEAAQIMALTETVRRTLETSELEGRPAELEEALRAPL